MRARGLKLVDSPDFDPDFMSRPMRARGLKHYLTPCRVASNLVAPHAGAWIETLR